MPAPSTPQLNAPTLNERRRSLWRGQHLGLWVVLTALAITVGHYTAGMDLPVVHNLLRRLYYLPIVMAAVGFGVRGGLATAAACSLAYLPHAFLMGGHEMMHHGHEEMGTGLPSDPSPPAEKALELVLFHGVGWVAGALSDRWARALARAEALTRKVEAALEERDRMRAQLVRSEKLGALGQLSAGLAHEIRNPLSSIRGSAEVIAEDYAEGTPKGRLAAIMLKELQHLEDVLTEFLQFARPPTPQPTLFDVHALVEEIGTLTASAREAAGVGWSANEASTLKTCWADRSHVRQVLFNLVLNAIQAMQRGGTVTVSVRNGRLHSGAALAIDVADQGAGIAPDDVTRIFEPFFTTKEQGTGLGLSISHSLADANLGVLDVSSTLGRGATFTLTLPVAEPRTG